MIAYCYDNDYNFTQEYECQLDPIRSKLEGKNVYLLPANATFTAPPTYDKENYIPVLEGSVWVLKDLPMKPDPASMLNLEKEEKIARSKTELETYLNTHPILWTDGQYYSITKEKQSQLTSKLAVAQAKATMGIPYELKWNTTSEVCVPWDISSLYALAFAIDEMVTTLVTYQQEKEVEIRNATTQEELDAIVVDYDTVL